MSKECILSFKY